MRKRKYAHCQKISHADHFRQSKLPAVTSFRTTRQDVTCLLDFYPPFHTSLHCWQVCDTSRFNRKARRGRVAISEYDCMHFPYCIQRQLFSSKHNRRVFLCQKFSRCATLCRDTVLPEFDVFLPIKSNQCLWVEQKNSSTLRWFINEIAVAT